MKRDAKFFVPVFSVSLPAGAFSTSPRSGACRTRPNLVHTQGDVSVRSLALAVEAARRELRASSARLSHADNVHCTIGEDDESGEEVLTVVNARTQAICVLIAEGARIELGPRTRTTLRAVSPRCVAMEQVSLYDAPVTRVRFAV